MAAKLGPTPLLAVEAVAVDLETTGLNVRTARIVQIGAVPFAEGRPKDGAGFSMLVNPGVPIPATATAIHGLSNADVLGARSVAGALAELARFIGGRPVIGHAVGFDLAVINAEARRVGGREFRPRFLDTRLLGELVAPALPEFTLEALGAWLGVEPEGRHSAIGDALTAARIFAALVPHLRARGVRTWAEAERACLELPRERAGLAEQGWVATPVGGPPEAEAGPLMRIDSYPYRHRVREIMTSPPRFLEAGRTLDGAAAVMAEAKISSVFVKDARGVGILTERDVLRAIAAEGRVALKRPAAAVASFPLECVSADAFIYRAIGRMTRLKVRHLGVTNAKGALVGALSARDLLKLRASEAIALGDAIETAGDIVALAAAWAPLPAVAEALLQEDVEAVSVAAVISRELGDATRRAAELAQDALRAEGEGPPVPYAVLVLGSAGRGESLLALDQDNAIVFRSGEPDGPEDRYFARLGGKIADTLDTIGVPYCKGGVMAREPAWRGSIETWASRIAGWLARSSPEDLLSVDIFFDAKAVHGDVRLARSVIAEAHAEASRAPHFVKLLAEANWRPPSAFGLFGGFRTDGNGRVDLKRAALLSIVSFARVLAMRHGIEERSTQERLQRLESMKKGGAHDLAEARAAHKAVLAAILAQQIRDIHAGLPPGNAVEIAKLTRREQAKLRAALKLVPRLEHLVRDMLF